MFEPSAAAAGLLALGEPALAARVAALAARVEPPSEHAMRAMEAHLDSLTKPLGSLGALEALAIQLAGVYRDPRLTRRRKAVIVACADNGVVCEGVSSCPPSVTAQVTENFMRGFTGINVFTRLMGAALTVVDLGVAADLTAYSPTEAWPRPGDEPVLLPRRVMCGTRNIAVGPAMGTAQMLTAVLLGAEVAAGEVESGAGVLGTGEMGIGNTTTASALLAALSGRSVAEVTGRGAGLTDAALQSKVRVIERALEANQPLPSDPLQAVAQVGGLDIAGLVGVFLGGAAAGVPVVIDGFISGVAALAALRYCPALRAYLIPSHASAEAGTMALFGELSMEPPIRLGMRLGEGTGAALAFGLIDLACAIVTGMGTFGDAGIEQYKPQH